MHPPIEPSTAIAATAAPRGDEDDLYRRHHHHLERAVARAVNAPRELIEDACQSAWAILLRAQPERDTIFSWLYVVAIRQAYRLSAIERRDARLESLTTKEGDRHDAIAAAQSLDTILEAREALQLLAALPERQRTDVTLLVAGYSYREIAELTGGRTFTNVSKHLAKARARLRLARLRGTASSLEQPEYSR